MSQTHVKLYRVYGVNSITTENWLLIMRESNWSKIIDTEKGYNIPAYRERIQYLEEQIIENEINSQYQH